MAPHQERVVNERAELDEKIVKLGAVFQTATFKNIDAAEQVRMVKQHSVMNDYSTILGERIAAFK